MIRAATWAAVSSVRQATDDKVSLDIQREACHAKATELGATVAHELTVPGKSRNIILFEDACKQIQAYADLKTLLEGREIDLLIFYTKSRLGRTLALCETVVALCQTSGVAVYDLSAPPSTIDPQKQLRSSGDVLISAVTSATAQNDNTSRSIAQENGMIGRIKAGHMPNRTPFGYQRVYDKEGKYTIEIAEDEAETIRLAFELYLQGYGVDAISFRLNSANRPRPTGGKWVERNLAQAFDRVWTYAGYAEVNRRSKSRPYTNTKGKHPAIISEEIAMRVVAERRRRVTARRAVSETRYLLSGLVRCSQCGRLMHCDRINVVCSFCKRYVSFNKIIQAIYQETDRVSQGHGPVNLVEQSAIDELERRLEELRTLEKKASDSINRIHTAYVDGLMEYGTYKEQVKRVQLQAEQIQANIKEVIAAIQNEESRRERYGNILTFAQVGRMTIETGEIKPTNAFLREYLYISFDPSTRQIVVTWR